MSDLRCLCGGHIYTRDELIAMSQDDPEGIGWEGMWKSLMGPFAMYCSEDDEVLTEPETWEVLGLYTPVHDTDYGLIDGSVADLSLSPGELIW